MSYRVLFLPDTVQRLSLPALRKIRTLVADGAVLVGQRPVGGLGMASPDGEIAKLADEIWGDGAPGRSLGRGRVYTNLASALAAEKVTPDIAFADKAVAADLLTLHRHTADADIYFVSNQSAEPRALDAVFRVDGRAPELWRAETGRREAVSYEQTDTGVRAQLDLAGHDAVFVVFDKPSPQKAWTAPPRHAGTLATLEGPWRVGFEAKRGAPDSAMFDKLISWPEATDPGIKYFSGVATYQKDIRIQRGWLKAGQRIELDLGEVKELAAISVNGKLVATAWHAPYRVDITDALKPGKNALAVAVVNLWPNRLIGDKQPGAKPVAFAPVSPYRADSPLLPSGLLGPVRLLGLPPATTRP